MYKIKKSTSMYTDESSGLLLDKRIKPLFHKLYRRHHRSSKLHRYLIAAVVVVVTTVNRKKLIHHNRLHSKTASPKMCVKWHLKRRNDKEQGQMRRL